jgi:tetratricopeptide (TPR) repeat protein
MAAFVSRACLLDLQPPRALRRVTMPLEAPDRQYWRAAVGYVAKRLAEFQPHDIQWTISLAYATRRADSIQAAKEILLNAESRFPKEAIIKYNLACYFCQLGDIENAKSYLKKAIEIDSTWRLQALDDEDLRLRWDSL